jgi:hypothetical protein
MEFLEKIPSEFLSTPSSKTLKQNKFEECRWDLQEFYNAYKPLSYTIVKAICFPQGENNNSKTPQYAYGNKAKRNREESCTKMENWKHYLKVTTQATSRSSTHTWDPIDILVALAYGQDFR